MVLCRASNPPLSPSSFGLGRRLMLVLVGSSTDAIRAGPSWNRPWVLCKRAWYCSLALDQSKHLEFIFKRGGHHTMAQTLALKLALRPLRVMSNLPVAVIVGAGSKHDHDGAATHMPPSSRWGLGGALSLRFAAAGYHVILLGVAAWRINNRSIHSLCHLLNQHTVSLQSL